MKRLLTTAALVLLTMPILAQDEVVLTGGDIDALLGGGGGGGNRGGGNRGGGRGGNQVPDPLAMFDQLKDLLKTKKVPLDKAQEKPLQALLDSEVKGMQAFIDEQFGNRGNQNNRNNPIAQIDPVVVKHNGELLTQMKADLTPDQLALITKAEKDKKACIVMLDVVNTQQFNRGGGDFNRGPQQDQPSRPQCTSQNSTTAQRLAVIGDLLNKGKKPLTAEQTTKFSALIEARFPLIQEELRASGLPVDQLFNRNNNNNNNQNNPQQLTNNIVNTILSQLGVPNNNNNNNRGNRGGNAANPADAANAGANFNRGGRGAQAGQGGQADPAAAGGRGGQGGRGNNFNPQQEIQKRTDETLDKVIASLKPDQQPVVKKFKYDMIKQRGPVDKIRAILEQEGTPLTPEQVTQITALYNSENQAIRSFAQGLVQTEVQALPASAFEPAPQPAQNQQNQQQGRNNNNQNNVNQNPAAQQIVSKVLPQVSVRRALLDKATLDSVMRVLTPSQVASYKLSSL